MEELLSGLAVGEVQRTWRNYIITQSILQSHWDLCTSAQIYGYAKYFESQKLTLVYLKLFSEVVLNYSDEDTCYKSQRKLKENRIL